MQTEDVSHRWATIHGPVLRASDDENAGTAALPRQLGALFEADAFGFALRDQRIESGRCEAFVKPFVSYDSAAKRMAMTE